MELTQLLPKLDRQDKALLLADAILEATVAARIADVSDFPASNAFVHSMSGYMKEVLQGTGRPTDEVIAATVTHHFEKMGVDVGDWLERL